MVLQKGKISWAVRVIYEGLSKGKEDRNILQTVKRRKTNWIGHVLCVNWLLTHVIEGKIDGRSDGRMRKKK